MLAEFMSIMRSFVVASFLALSAASGLFSAETSPSVQDQSKKKNADDDPKTFLHVIPGAPCGASGYYQLLRNTHPSRTIQATIITVLNPGGRMMDSVISIGPEKVISIGCSKRQGSSEHDLGN